MRALTVESSGGNGQTVLQGARMLVGHNAHYLGQVRAGPPDAGELGGAFALNIRAARSYGQIPPVSGGTAALYRNEIQPYTR